MPRPAASADATPSVVPLRMPNPDGGHYLRPSNIEAMVAELSRLQAREIAERSRIEGGEHPAYIPSECVLYFVRRPDLLNDEDAHREMFMVLRQRVLQAVPVRSRRLADSGKVGENSMDLEIQERALHKFHQMLCSDRAGYDLRLDFYEVRFNSAIETLRLTARRDVRRKEPPVGAIALVDEENVSLEDGDSPLTGLLKSMDGEGIDFLYRSKLHLEISSLPDDERRVVELLLNELPIDSQDPNAQTIVRALGCSEKTVRNRRDRAYKKLRDALKEEEGA